MLARGGELDGVRLLGRKTIELMTSNHLGGDMASMGQAHFSESTYVGIGFGLRFSVMLDPAAAQIVGTPGKYAWGGGKHSVLDRPTRGPNCRSADAIHALVHVHASPRAEGLDVSGDRRLTLGYCSSVHRRAGTLAAVVALTQQLVGLR
jgi:hypothetical protein